MSSEAALLEEINRLSGAINRRKTTQPPPQPSYRGRGRGGQSHKPPYRGRGAFTDYTPVTRPGVAGPSRQTREVVVDGVTFQSNGKTLVRKTATSNAPSEKVPSPTLSNSSPAISTASTPSTATTQAASTARTSPTLATANLPNSKPLVRTRNGLIAVDRFKQAGSKPTNKPPPRQPYNRPITGYPKRAQPGRNLTLNKKKTVVKSKKWEKQCKHFTMTGMCGRGLTCKYQHDPNKIALCPLFLTEKCPYKDKPEQCSLSHDPTPERTPICVRFNSTGQCYKGSDCLYPHIRVGAKTGICRDFAVLGYCEKGASCEASHLKECPDFAETGVCKRMGIKGANGCHLPHVIRANQKKIGIATKAQVAAAASKDNVPPSSANPGSSPTVASAQPVIKKRYIPPGMVLGETSSTEPKSTSGDQPGTSETAVSSSTVGEAGSSALPSADEFISLTFEESDDEEDDDEEGDDEDEEDGEEEEEEEEDEDGEDEDADAEEVDKEMQVADDDDTGDAW